MMLDVLVYGIYIRERMFTKFGNEQQTYDLFGSRAFGLFRTLQKIHIFMKCIPQT